MCITPKDAKLRSCSQQPPHYTIHIAIKPLPENTTIYISVQYSFTEACSPIRSHNGGGRLSALCRWPLFTVVHPHSCISVWLLAYSKDPPKGTTLFGNKLNRRASAISNRRRIALCCWLAMNSCEIRRSVGRRFRVVFVWMDQYSLLLCLCVYCWGCLATHYIIMSVLSTSPYYDAELKPYTNTHTHAISDLREAGRVSPLPHYKCIPNGVCASTRVLSVRPGVAWLAATTSHR